MYSTTFDNLSFLNKIFMISLNCHACLHNDPFAGDLRNDLTKRIIIVLIRVFHDKERSHWSLKVSGHWLLGEVVNHSWGVQNFDLKIQEWWGTGNLFKNLGVNAIFYIEYMINLSIYKFIFNDKKIKIKIVILSVSCNSLAIPVVMFFNEIQFLIQIRLVTPPLRPSSHMYPSKCFIRWICRRFGLQFLKNLGVSKELVVNN
jgi:hypothetical protein